MKDLIEALSIFIKYFGDIGYPFHCEHDTLYVCGVNPEEVSKVDLERLEELGFFVGNEYDDWFISYKYGSC